MGQKEKKALSSFVARCLALIDCERILLTEWAEEVGNGGEGQVFLGRIPEVLNAQRAANRLLSKVDGFAAGAVLREPGDLAEADLDACRASYRMRKTINAAIYLDEVVMLHELARRSLRNAMRCATEAQEAIDIST